jgi:flagellum-specific peptidoglycan hydrolase FlgJ
MKKELVQIVAIVAFMAWIMPKAQEWQKRKKEGEARPRHGVSTGAKLVSVDNQPTGLTLMPEAINFSFIKGEGKEAEFIKELAKLAIDESSRVDWKVPPSLIVAQAVLESNYGRSMLAKKANNYFGHKWRGEGGWILADDDQPKERFTKYKSRWFSVRAHTNLLMSPLYHGRLKGSPTLENWLDALCGSSDSVVSKRFVKGGGMVYATACYNSCYACKLRAVVERWNLQKLDINQGA